MSIDTIKNLKSWAAGVEVEQLAIQQLRNIASLPILGGHIAVMPDVHMGIGATVGSVIPTGAAIIPSAVGVDIGCGMCAVPTDLQASNLPDSLACLRSAIEAAVPVGFNAHAREVRTLHDGMGGQRLHLGSKALGDRYERLRVLSWIGRHDHRKTFRQLGTLGGGNHFIELCLDEVDGVWVMLHSGSRNIGKTIGEAAIGRAKDRAQAEAVNLPDRDLAWLDEGTEDFDTYVEGLRWAQEYAAHNRQLMLHEVLKAMRAVFGREVATAEHAVNCHHNYASFEEHFGDKVWVTRKGAVSARAANSESSRARWGHARSSCAARATPTPTAPAATVPGGGCRAARPSAPSASRTSSRRPAASSAARKRASLTRSRAPTRTRRRHGGAVRARRCRAHAQAGHVHQGLRTVRGRVTTGPSAFHQPGSVGERLMPAPC